MPRTVSTPPPPPSASPSGGPLCAGPSGEAHLVLGAGRVPLSTYRVQLNHAFTFDDAAAIVPYLDALGVTDLYASPFFKARPGSMHGYDLVDHNVISPEIGGPEGLTRLTDALAARGMGLVLDFVPNHMGVHSADNVWWTDLLENGPGSLYAPFFDVDFEPLRSHLSGKVLLPILGEHYGSVLERGEIRVEYEQGAFYVVCPATRLPLRPISYATILERMLPGLIESLGAEHDAVLELQSILTGLRYLPPPSETKRAKVLERRREKEILKRRIASLVSDSPIVAAALSAEVERINGRPGDGASFDVLDRLLEEQCYRLSFWKVAAEEINYRRFFDINDLAAIRMENPAVFAEAHRLVFELVREGRVTGLRIDHPDGLWDPRAYFSSLAEAGRGGPEGKGGSLYVVVEKILSRGEKLPEEWEVHGTSGYDFLNLVLGVLVDDANEAAMTELYARFLGERVRFDDLVYEKKKLVLRTSLVSELMVLADELSRLAKLERHTRDFTLGALTDAVREIIACFPIYRTYVNATDTEPDEHDRVAVSRAFRAARRRNPTADPGALDLVHRVLMLEIPREGTPQKEAARWRDWVMRFQQLTGPVMAKGLEDTAFYIYNRLVALNEVGGEPERFGLPPAAFHAANAERRRLWPCSMLASSTHDTKRSEDVRARLTVLSEMPEEFGRAAESLRQAAAPFRADLEGTPAPSENDEYLFYQSVLGTWEPGKPSEAYVQRLVDYMRKATKEAKVQTSWINANPEYDAAVEAFVRETLGSPDFLAVLAETAREVAFFGLWNGLTQVLLKLASPGVPDTYQGQEAWDYSLVDPDNRRPVAFERLSRDLEVVSAEPTPEAARALVESAADGRIKLFVTRACLHAKRRAPLALGPSGSYAPVFAVGKQGAHVIAFRREGGGSSFVAVAPRLTRKLTGGRMVPPTGAAFAETLLVVPEGTYRNVFTGARLEARRSRLGGGEQFELEMQEVLADFPVALLERLGERSGQEVSA